MRPVRRIEQHELVRRVPSAFERVLAAHEKNSAVGRSCGREIEHRHRQVSDGAAVFQLRDRTRLAWTRRSRSPTFTAALSTGFALPAAPALAGAALTARSQSLGAGAGRGTRPSALPPAGSASVAPRAAGARPKRTRTRARQPIVFRRAACGLLGSCTRASTQADGEGKTEPNRPEITSHHRLPHKRTLANIHPCTWRAVSWAAQSARASTAQSAAEVPGARTPEPWSGTDWHTMPWSMRRSV
jgi:hypothetical protein